MAQPASPRTTSFLAVTGQSHSPCGYCHSNADTSASIGAWAYALTASDYQHLLDRGWRRSGKYLYKPRLSETCCPCYTIRCDVSAFKPTKGQKKVIKKMKAWCSKGKGRVGGLREEADDDEGAGGDGSGSGDKMEQPTRNVPSGPTLRPSLESTERRPKNKPPKQNKSGQQPTDILALIRDAEATTEDVHTHRMKVVLTRADFHEDTFALFCKYQQIIHKDPPEKLTKKKYTHFLVDTPLIPVPGGPRTPGLGSFHQKYYFGDQLAAVAVLDILPGCISSVYLMYDPDYAWLSLGTYSALREVGLAKMLDLPYYYMGYYIHSCSKMRYKANFNPSDLLCPKTYAWVPTSDAMRKLDKNKAPVLSSGSQGVNDELELFRDPTGENVPDHEIEEFRAFHEGVWCQIKVSNAIKNHVSSGFGC
ncbi:arginine-tRNA-protein transferase [Gaertneriomyces semiglobifer]|nr:arginine-tRNA-protein transferase [Gaertneriomyces semiglobifer]